MKKNEKYLKIVFYGLALVVLGSFLSNAAMAQAVSAQSQPALSPWLSMFNNNRGVLSNYHEYVKPQQNMYRAYQNQQQQIRAQETRQRELQTEMNQMINEGPSDRILAEPRKTKSIGGMQGAGFRQYQHYYQGGLRQGGVPQFATGRKY